MGLFLGIDMKPLYLLANGDTFRHAGVTWVVVRFHAYSKYCRPFGTDEEPTEFHYDTEVMVDEF